jgi:hypothetical protein
LAPDVANRRLEIKVAACRDRRGCARDALRTEDGGPRRANETGERKCRWPPEQCRRLAVLYRQITPIPERIMSDHRSTGPLRHPSFNRAAARADVAAASMWTTLWMWLAAIAAVAAFAVVLGVVFGYSHSDQEVQAGEPLAAGSAPASVPPAPLSMPQPDDARAPAPATPADDGP